MAVFREEGTWPSQAWRLTPEVTRPVTKLQTDIPSGRLITVRDDDPLEYRGAIGDISRSGVQIPPSPFLLPRTDVSGCEMYVGGI
jgi:hypothetical protein